MCAHNEIDLLHPRIFQVQDVGKEAPLDLQMRWCLKWPPASAATNGEQ